jgi:hypothetical protein
MARQLISSGRAFPSWRELTYDTLGLQEYRLDAFNLSLFVAVLIFHSDV